MIFLNSLYGYPYTCSGRYYVFPTTNKYLPNQVELFTRRTTNRQDTHELVPGIGTSNRNRWIMVCRVAMKPMDSTLLHLPLPLPIMPNDLHVTLSIDSQRLYANSLNVSPGSLRRATVQPWYRSTPKTHTVCMVNAPMFKASVTSGAGQVYRNS